MRLSPRFALVVTTLMVLAIVAEEVATDIFLPCLPLMGDYFGVNDASAQLTVSLYLFGLAIARPLYGALSDCFGRKPVLVSGMFLFFIASGVCYFSQHIEFLIIGRFFQGIGAGVAIVIGFAAVKDIYDEKKCARIMSLMSFTIAVAPAMAPIIGGHLSDLYGWQSTFLLIVVLSGTILASIIFFMPETLAHSKRHKFHVGELLRSYYSVIIHHRFMYYVGIQSLSIGALWAWLAGAPNLFVDHLGVPVHYYGYYCFSGVVAYMSGTLLNYRLLRYLTLDEAIFRGLIAMTSSCAVLFLNHLIGYTNPIVIQSLNIPFGIGIAMILSNATTGAMESIEHGRGIGASIIGTMQMLFGSIGSYFVGYWSSGTIIPISAVMLACVTGAIFSYILLRRYKAKFAFIK